MRAAAVLTAFGVTAGLTACLTSVLDVPLRWAVFLSAILAFSLLVLALFGPWSPWGGAGATSHPVTIVEGNGFLVALCDVDDCAWMEFAHPDDPAAQEKELRAAAAGHTRAAVPEVKRWAAA